MKVAACEPPHDPDALGEDVFGKAHRELEERLGLDGAEILG